MSVFDVFPPSVEVGTETGVRADNLNVIECDDCGTLYATVPWGEEVYGVSCEVCDYNSHEELRPTATSLGHISEADVELSDLYGYEESDEDVVVE